MNKTVLLACCDFLILATLSLNYNPKVSNSQNEPIYLPISNDFQLIEPEDDKSELLLISNLYESQLKQLKEESNTFQKKLITKENDFEKLNEDYLRLQSRYQQLITNQQSDKSLYSNVTDSLIGVTVNMKEDDSFSPDLFRNK